MDTIQGQGDAWFPTEGGGWRYWDGAAWTNFVAPPHLEALKPLRFSQVMMAVVLGMLIAWGLIYLGAQAAPDAIYWPVKFVVEDLPSFTPAP